MGFWQRLGAFFGFRAAGGGGGGVEPRAARGLPIWRRDQAGMLGAFSDYPYLHTVVQARAESAARVNWQVWEISRKNTRAEDLDLHCLRGAEYSAAVEDLLKEGVLKPQLNSDLLRLLRRPSLRMTGPDFWELSSKYEDLLGETVWIKGARQGRRPTRLHLYVPTWLQREPGEGDDAYTFQLPTGRITIPARDVIWRKRHNPVDPYGARGLGTAYVLRDELQLDELLAVMARSRAANKNYPDLLLGLLGRAGGIGPGPGQAEVDIVTKLLEQKHGGPERVGQAHVIAGDFKAQALGHTFVESQYMESRRFGRDTNMQTFRMPPEIAGVLENANRSTIDVARDQFESTATVPKLERWRASIQDELVPDFGENLVVGFKSPVPADRDYEAGIMKALPGAFTLNEIRSRGGEQPRGDGDAYYKAPGAVPVAGSPSSPVDAPKENKK